MTPTASSRLPRAAWTARTAAAAGVAALVLGALPPSALAGHANTASTAGYVPPRLDARCSPAVVLEGFSDHLDGTTFDGVPVANLSALAQTPDGRLLALSDRSALVTLDGGTREPAAVTPLADAAGAALDSEGLARDVDGTLWVSSETGPQVLHLAADGAVLGAIDVPAPLRVAPQGRAVENQSLEGLTLSRDGLTLLAATEGPLTGDDDGVVRLQTWTRPATTAPFTPGAQHALRVDPGLGVSEVLLTPDGRLVVLERGFLASIGNTVRLYLADPRGGADTSGTAELTEDVADDVALPTTLLADLVTCPPSGATARQQQLNPLLDNIEGMALLTHPGHPGHQGHPGHPGHPSTLHLLLVSDNNENPAQTTRLYDLAVTLP